MDMYNVTKRIHFAIPLFFVAFAMVLSAAPADAVDEDPIFTINHYWTYLVPEPITVSVNVLLMDQFGLSQHNALLLDRFAIPVDKNGEGIIDPIAHLSWWRFLDGTDSPFRRVVVTNQFGEHELEVFEAEYLLAPALKNPEPNGDEEDGGSGLGDPELGALDHYKCYKVLGPSTDRFVTLSDQFQLGEGDVLEPVYLCNPVDKIRQDTGGRFPIVKPTEHLVCYNLLFPASPVPGLIFRDQFAEAQIPLDVVDLLCVPSTKEQVVQVEDSSWGKMKSLYR